MGIITEQYNQILSALSAHCTTLCAISCSLHTSCTLRDNDATMHQHYVIKDSLLCCTFGSLLAQYWFRSLRYYFANHHNIDNNNIWSEMFDYNLFCLQRQHCLEIIERTVSMTCRLVAMSSPWDKHLNRFQAKAPVAHRRVTHLRLKAAGNVAGGGGKPEIWGLWRRFKNWHVNSWSDVAGDRFPVSLTLRHRLQLLDRYMLCDVLRYIQCYTSRDMCLRLKAILYN